MNAFPTSRQRPRIASTPHASRLTPHVRTPRKPVHSASPTNSRAFVLVGILVLVMLVSMIALSLLFRLKAEDTAASASTGAEQAWAAAMSGVQQAMRIATSAVPGSTDWQDLPQSCRDRFVFDDGSEQWFFTICSPPSSDSLQELRYGLTDEASKINVNYAHTANLAHLPGMTPALVDSLRDFIDPDSTPRADGAEQEFYDALPISRAVFNRPLDTLDQMLLVRGFTPGLLYGEDANQNFRLDPNENDGDEHFPLDNNDSRLDLGLRQYLTVSSYDPNQDNDGAPRTNLNDAKDPLPQIELPPALTKFIAALRTNKFQTTHAAALLRAKVKVPGPKGGQSEVESGIGKAELPLALDLFTGTGEARQQDIININTASAPVLASVPGIDPPLAESICSARNGISPERRATIAWLYQEGLVDSSLFKRVAPFLAARSFQYSFHVVGYALPSARYRVLDVIIDVASGKPRITYLRDLTHLGLPFKPGAERVETTVAQTRPSKEARGG